MTHQAKYAGKLATRGSRRRALLTYLGVLFSRALKMTAIEITVVVIRHDQGSSRFFGDIGDDHGQ